jgi:hypothetical protein
MPVQFSRLYEIFIFNSKTSKRELKIVIGEENFIFSVFLNVMKKKELFSRDRASGGERRTGIR